MKKCWMLFLGLLIISCSSSTKGSHDDDRDIRPPDGMAGFTEIVIHTEVTNKEQGIYHVYLADPEKYGGIGVATRPDDYIGPYETNAEGMAVIDLENNTGLEYLLQRANENELKVIVATVEDFNIYNSLNEETYVEFVENSDDETYYQYRYLSKTGELNLDIVDKYPDGIISLPFPDAFFVLKLKFDDNANPLDSYTVSLYDHSINARTGRIVRKGHYYNYPVYEDDRYFFDSSTFEIIVEGGHPETRISYEGEPKFIEFDNQGNCLQGENNVVTITIL